MRFMTLVKSREDFRGGPPPPALMEAIGKLGEEALKSGIMIEMGGLCASNEGTRIRLSGGKLTLTDGPFSEAKEVVGGYAIFNLKSKEEAIKQGMIFMKLHQDLWPEWEGETEIRQIMDGAPDFDRKP